MSLLFYNIAIRNYQFNIDEKVVASEKTLLALHQWQQVWRLAYKNTL